MATRKDVAKLAGVSTATVSYYVNNSGYVSSETREKIAEAIRQLDYQPNMIAKSLKMKDTKQLVFICNEIRNPFHAQVAYRATKEAYKKGYMTLFCNIIDDEEYIKKICNYQVSGIFIATSKISDSFLEHIAGSRIPIVMLDDRPEKTMPTGVSRILIDYSGTMKELIAQLIRENRKKICYISSTDNESSETTDGKTKAVIMAAEERKEEIDLLVLDKITSAQDAYEAVTRQLVSDSKADSYLCTNDAVALGAQRAVYDQGYRLGEEVKVIGIDNTFLSSLSIPAITSVDNQAEELSRKAIEMLVRKCQKLEVSDYLIVPQIKYR